MDQSPFLDSHRRERPGRQSDALDGRRRRTQRAAQARFFEGFAAVRYRDRDRGLSGQERIEESERSRHHVRRWKKAVCRVVGHRGSGRETREMRGLAIAIAAVAAGAVLSPRIVPAAAQAPAFSPPRTADGRPNLNGIWQAQNTADWDLQAHAAQAGRPDLGAIGAVPPGLSVVEGNQIPYRPAALAKKEENFKKRMTADPEVKCYLPGVPRATYQPFPFQIVQTPSAILISYQFANASRVIKMAKLKPAPVDSRMGQSSGSWAGATLVF